MRHVVTISGGKDSTAMLLEMIKRDWFIDKVVYADSKLEFREMYLHVKNLDRYCVEKLGFRITVLQTNQEFDDWFYGKITRGKLKGGTRGFPYAGYPCYWCRESKKKVIESYLNEDDVVYEGMTTDELQRAGREDRRYPLIEWGWSEEDCRNRLKGTEFYPPILQKFDRTGCWLCPKQSTDSLYVIYKDYPEKWEKLRKYAKDSPHSFKSHKTIKEFHEDFKKREQKEEWLRILNS